jgi:alpha-glucuronidase
MVFLQRFLQVLFLQMVLVCTIWAYNGSETWLHYTAVPADLKASYSGVCKSLVLSDANSDTLKNAKAEFDIAMPKLLGAALPVADGAGAIVLAPEGAPQVAAASIDFTQVDNEGFVIKSAGGKTYISGKSQVGVLRGAFHFLRMMQLGKPIDNLNVVENPYFPYRVLDHWVNHYGSSVSTERVYGGDRPFKMENFGRMSATELQRTRDYCRMAVSLGLNGMCPDNVNTYRSGSLGNYKCLEEANLITQKVFCDIIGTYGLKYYLSVSYASPRIVNPKLGTANAYADAQAKQWWFDKVDLVVKYISNFGGFLMKADSEGEEGPRTTYKQSQSQGANPIAAALKRVGAIMIWRTFIYDTSDPDFAVNQSKEFADPPQQWDDAVVVRMKDGPRDFQMVEPPHQLLSMTGVRLGMEFQITQEYTGQDKHLCWLVPRWKEVLDFNVQGATPWTGAPGTITHQLIKGAGQRTGGVWAISNLSDAANWTGHYLAQANYYGWGRLAWNPTLSADQIADEWVRCSFDNGYKAGVAEVVKYLLMTSWESYTDYTIGHSALMPALGNNNHYNVDFNNMRNINFYTDWFMDFAKNCSGIGVSRCNGTGGTVRNDFAHKYYTPELADMFCDQTKCPEQYILFFHHLPWEYKMKGGMTLIQQLQFEHFNGIHRVQKYIKYWKLLNTVSQIDAEIYSHVSSKFNTQLTDASKWAKTFRDQFGACYSTEVPSELAIVPPTPDAATTVEVGTPVNLTAQLKTQKGTAVTGATFGWSIVEPGASATLSATTGASTAFTANAPGIYTVRLWDTRWPNQYEEEMVFAGNWVDASPTGTNTVLSRIALPSLKIMQVPQGFRITSPIAGTVSIVSLQGREVKSLSMKKPGTLLWETRGAARGMYLLQIRNETQTIRGKLHFF